MRIALIRHGQTIGNLYKAYIGRTDQPLCEEGKVDLLRRKRSGTYPPVDHLFSSPMLRCLQTAAILYPKQAYVQVPQLVERDFGLLEGLNHQEITAKPGFEDWGKTAESMVFPGGESWEEFAERSCMGFLEAVRATALLNLQTMGIICHGGTIMAIMNRYADAGAEPHQWQCEAGCGYVLQTDSRLQHVRVSRRISPPVRMY